MALLTAQTTSDFYELFNSTVWQSESFPDVFFVNGDSFFLDTVPDPETGDMDLTFSFNFSNVVLLPFVQDFIFAAGVSNVDFTGTLFMMDGAFTTFTSTGTAINVSQNLGFGTSGSFTVSALVSLTVEGDFENSGRVDVFGGLTMEQDGDIDVVLKGNNAQLRVEGDMTGLVTTDAGVGITRLIVDSGGNLTFDPVDNPSLFVLQASSTNTDSVVVTNSGTITGLVALSAGNDTVTNESAGVFNGSVSLGSGGNALTNRGQITGDVTGGDDIDNITLAHGSRIDGGINLNDGDDNVGTSGFGAGSIIVGGPVFLGGGDDSFAGSFSNVGFDVDGNEGDDTIVGSAAGDRISGGSGTNTVNGGLGIDTFVFNVESGLTTINDFNEFETLEIRGLLTEDFFGRMTIQGDKPETINFGFEGRMNASRQQVDIDVISIGSNTVISISSGLTGYSQTHREDFSLTIGLINFDIEDFELSLLNFVTSETPLAFV